MQFCTCHAKMDKAPGADGIPYRFLKAMGEPLTVAVAGLLTQCWRAEYYPAAFRSARTVVLRKPNKPNYSKAEAWRPIALLNTVAKILETITAHQLCNLAEQQHMLPDTQMGNCSNWSTETALELLTEQIQTVWTSKRHVASVLSLDMSGAFNTVNHTQLLDNL